MRLQASDQRHRFRQAEHALIDQTGIALCSVAVNRFLRRPSTLQPEYQLC